MKYIEYVTRRFMARFDRFEPMIMDSTARKAFKKCDRFYFYRIVLGFAPVKEKYQANLDWGTARHVFREKLELFDIQVATSAALKVNIAESEVKKYRFLNDRVRLQKMLAVDYDNWEKEKEQGKIVTVEGSIEQPINIQLPDGSYSGGRVDKMIMWMGQLWDLDYKTSTKDQAYFASEKDPDDQATRYIYMLSKLHGNLIGGIVFDVMYNLESVVNQSYKVVIQKTQQQLDDWEKGELHLNKQLESNRAEDIWPMREGACQFCPFQRVCKKSNEKSMMAELEANYVLRPWDFEKIRETDT